MSSKERLLKYIEIEVYRPAQIIFKKLFEIKSRYDLPWGSFNPIMRVQIAMMCWFKIYSEPQWPRRASQLIIIAFKSNSDLIGPTRKNPLNIAQFLLSLFSSTDETDSNHLPKTKIIMFFDICFCIQKFCIWCWWGGRYQNKRHNQ